MHPPEHVGEHDRVLAGIAGSDRAGDDELRRVDPVTGEDVVQHPRVGALGREGDRGARALGLRPDGGAPVDEQQGAAPQGTHTGQHLPYGRHRPDDRERQRALDVGRGRLQDRLHEVPVGNRAVLQDLDRAEIRRRRVQGGGESGRVVHVGGETARVHPRTAEIGGEGVDVLLRTGEEGDVEALAPEPAGHGAAQPRARSDDGDGGHVGVLCSGSGFSGGRA